MIIIICAQKTTENCDFSSEICTTLKDIIKVGGFVNLNLNTEYSKLKDCMLLFFPISEGLSRRVMLILVDLYLRTFQVNHFLKLEKFLIILFKY